MHPRAALLPLLLAASCRSAAPVPGAAAPAAGAPASVGIDPAAVDPKASPCDDFYQYACGGWLARAEIPPDKSRWNRSFDEMREANRWRLRAILEDAAAGRLDPGDPDARKVGDYWSACMDEQAVERSGLGSLRQAWAGLEAMGDAGGLVDAVGRLHAQGITPFFSLHSDQDARDSSQVIGVVFQGGLTLPDRDYYLLDEPRSRRIREEYQVHLARMLELAGVPGGEARAEARDVVSLERSLAESHWTRVEMRDPERTYNRIDLAGLRKAAPRFDWKRYLGALGEPGLAAFSATTPQALRRLNQIVALTPRRALRAYLRWKLLDRMADERAVPRALVEERFAFWSRSFTGQKSAEERWKHCVTSTSGALGEALGRFFVRRWFGEDAKREAAALVAGVEQAQRRNLAALPWMDGATRARAEEKLARVEDKIGYPSKWRDYSALQVRRDDFFASVLAAGAFEVRRDLEKIGKPLDRTEWQMTPQTVNAYYDSSMNEMVFPAGILQPPFYTQGANDAVNYGATGFVVGHELTHGFDDQGRKFDAQGNLTNWWTAATAAEFERRAGCVERQYQGYTAVDDVKLDGKLTLGENIADLGGLQLAWAAYQFSRAGRPPEPAVASFTPEQQFFLAAAQVWCEKIRPERARLMAKTDPHSPGRWRVNGPLVHLPAFARAFACQEGRPMARPEAERCEVW